MLLALLAFAFAPIFFIYSSEEEPSVMPDGFEYIKKLGATHIVLVTGANIDNPPVQQYAADLLCKEHGDPTNCEMYLFRDAKDIPDRFPIIRDKDFVMGYFRRMAGEETQFRRLYSGDNK